MQSMRKDPLGIAIVHFDPARTDELVQMWRESFEFGVGVQGALDAGLVINGLQEHYYAEWPMLASAVKESPGRYVLPEAPERLPLLFTLQASKPGTR
jgi:hypothetical protein